MQPVLKLAVCIVLAGFWSFGNYDLLALNRHAEKAYGQSVVIGATVSGNAFSAQGIVAPFASIVMSGAESLFIGSTTANDSGSFSVSGLLVPEELKTICMEAVDFKAIGSSTTCLDIIATSGSIVLENIFLPPTVGLAKTEIREGGAVSISGYSMPGATVRVYVGDTFENTTADTSGLYYIDIDNISAGEYSVYAVATYQGKESIKPTKFTQVKVLGFAGSITKSGINYVVIFICLLILILLILAYWKRKQLKRLLGIRN